MLQQCCDVTFDGEEINIVYYWHKIVTVEKTTDGEETVEEPAETATEA